METIRKILNSQLSIEGGLIQKVLEEIKNNGDIMIIKADGLRDSLGYSVIISSNHNRFDPIRIDSDNLENAILSVLTKYVG